MIDVTVAAEQPGSAETILEPMLLVEDGRVAGVGVGSAGTATTATPSGAVRVLVDFVPYDRAAGLSLIETTPLEQSGQWNVDLFVDLEVPSQNLDLLGALATVLRRCVQGLGQFDHNLDVIAGRSRRRCRQSLFKPFRRSVPTGRGSVGRWLLLLVVVVLLLERMEYPRAEAFRFAGMTSTATTTGAAATGIGIIGRIAITHGTFAAVGFCWVDHIIARLVEGSILLLACVGGNGGGCGGVLAWIFPLGSIGWHG